MQIIIGTKKTNSKIDANTPPVHIENIIITPLLKYLKNRSLIVHKILLNIYKGVHRTSK